MIQVTLKGNTYPIKETLKGLGFKWNQKERAWTQDLNNSEEDFAIEIANRWVSEGVYGTIKEK